MPIATIIIMTLVTTIIILLMMVLMAMTCRCVSYHLSPSSANNAVRYAKTTVMATSVSLDVWA